VRVTGILPPPAFINVNFSQLAGGTIVFNATNGATNGPYNLLTSTNLSLPLGQWTSVATGNFDANGNLNGQTGVSVTVNSASPQQFYILVGL
jgi:hypothetical protein